MRAPWALCACSILLAAGCASLAQAPDNLIRNPSFEQGGQAPTDWALSSPPGAWETTGHEGDRSISITRTPEPGSAVWTQTGIPVQPLTTYRFSFWARVAPGTTGGCIVSGPDFANRDLQAGEQWARNSHVFLTRPGQTSMAVRVGQWEKTGTVYFDDLRVAPVAPVHRSREGITLGTGEKTEDGGYSFVTELDAEGANYSRPLHDFNAGFNSNRWVFGPGNYVVYRHQIGDAKQTGGTVTVRVGWYASGNCLVEAGTDGEHWTALGTLGAVEAKEFPLPEGLFPAEAVYVRLRSPGQEEARGEAHPGSFQVHGYEYRAALDADVPDLAGSTRYLDVAHSDPRLAVSVADLGALTPGGDNVARLGIMDRTNGPLAVTATLGLQAPGAPQVAEGASFQQRASIPAGQQVPVRIPYEVHGAGAYEATLSVAVADEPLYLATTAFTVPTLYASDYGYPVAQAQDCAVWWCEGTYKVSRERAPVRAEGGETQAVRLSAARNEFEPVQVVLNPSREIKGLTATASALRGPGEIATENISICYAWYHHVARPTDGEGCVGWWPDALPPLDKPIDLMVAHTPPVCIWVKVPKGTPPGLYRGQIALQADGWQFTVPLALTVWNFTLPDDPSIESAFGLSDWSAFQYQNVTSAEDREHVWDLYLQNFRDHRIAPYSFWRSGINMQLTGWHWVGGDRVTDESYEGASSLKIVDDTDDAVAQAATAKSFRVDPEARYTFKFACKTDEPGRQYLVTFNSHDAGGSWISGHNLDIPFTGTGEWKQETLTFVPGDRSPDARSLTLTLRPALWTEDGKLKGTAWFDAISLVKEGSDENLIPDGGFETGAEQARVELDFSAWDEYARKYLDEYKFSTFSLPLAGMGGGTFHSRHYGNLGPYKQGTPEYRRLFKEYCTALEEHLDANGWLDKAFIYWFDEPEPKDYDFVREGMGEIKLAGPRLRRMLTEEPNEALAGAVDIWCPVLESHDPKACAERKAAGETIWWYVCTGPKAPYPTLFIDHSAVDLRVWLWMSWKWDVTGILVWHSNYWTSSCAYPDEPQNPWEDPMGYVSGYGLPPGYVGYWGNGDGRFIYPANKDVLGDKTTHLSGPVNSIRWEMLREGIEDYEYFTLLKKLVAEKGDEGSRALLEIPQEIIKGHREFTHDPSLMYAHREKLARAIEALGGE